MGHDGHDHSHDQAAVASRSLPIGGRTPNRRRRRMRSAVRVAAVHTKEVYHYIVEKAARYNTYHTSYATCYTHVTTRYK